MVSFVPLGFDFEVSASIFASFATNKTMEMAMEASFDMGFYKDKVGRCGAYIIGYPVHTWGVGA